MRTLRRSLRLIVVLVLVLAVGIVALDSAGVSIPAFLTGADVPLSQPSSDWRLLLVNHRYPLPEGYAVTLKQLRNDQLVDERIYPDLQRMFDDARAQGLSPLIVSSYRTEEYQTDLFERRVQEAMRQGMTRREAEADTADWVAAPGHSEHQTGLAVDVGAEAGSVWDVYRWLEEHCWEYGFILRYPEEKVAITKIANEPWHLRYVGVEAALAMRDSGQCLEEYLNAE